MRYTALLFFCTAAMSCTTMAKAAEGVAPSSTQMLEPRTLGTVNMPLHATRTIESGPAVTPPYLASRAQIDRAQPDITQEHPAASTSRAPYRAVTVDNGTLPVPHSPAVNAPVRRNEASAYRAHAPDDSVSATQPRDAQTSQTPLDYLVFSGGEVSGHGGRYGNLGAIGAIGDTHFGSGPVWRVMTDALGYNYVGGRANSTIEGRAYAGEAALGYIESFQGGSSVAGYVGGVYRHTSLSPNDPGNQLRGGQWGLKTQAEGTLYYTPDIRSGLQAAYVFGPDNWWTRANTQWRPSFLPWGNFFIGPEAVLQGDSTYTAWQAGALINGIHVTETSEIGIRAGYKKIQDLSGTLYGGAEFSTMF